MTLSQFRGKKVIVYFYPKDDTPGCTKQACGFAESLPQFDEKDAIINADDQVKAETNAADVLAWLANPVIL